MKRYRDCMLMCNDGQKAVNLLDIIETEAIKKAYKINRYNSFGNRDSLAVYIKNSGLPYSRLVLCILSDERCVSVVNIVPMPESGTSHIEPEEYNQLLELFKVDVFDAIAKSQGNKIETNSEDYTIQELIPLSFGKLNTWLSAYPLSSHQLDTNRWYDFVISLHQNDEHLSLDDFGKYIKEEYGWDDEDINKAELRLESHLDLIEYYDNHR